MSTADVRSRSRDVLLFADGLRDRFVWITDKVPETMGKSLEQIQESWAEHDETRSAPKAPTRHVDLD